MLQRGRQPAGLLVAAVEKTRRTVAQIAATAAAHLAACRQCLRNLLASMYQLHQVQHDGSGLHFASLWVDDLGIAHQCQTGGFATGVELQAQRLQITRSHLAIHEPDHHRHQAMHPRPATRQQQPGALFGAGHQRLALGV